MHWFVLVSAVLAVLALMASLLALFGANNINSSFLATNLRIAAVLWAATLAAEILAARDLRWTDVAGGLGLFFCLITLSSSEGNFKMCMAVTVIFAAWTGLHHMSNRDHVIGAVLAAMVGVLMAGVMEIYQPSPANGSRLVSVSPPSSS